MKYQDDKRWKTPRLRDILKEEGQTGKNTSEGCNVQIHIDIDHVDQLNICSCSPLSAPVRLDDAVDQDTDYADCIPYVTGHKPKQDLQERLSPFRQSNRIPSVLASLFVQQVRRYLRGLEPQNELEIRAFTILQRLPESTRQILECLCKKIDEDPAESRLFSSEVSHLQDQPISGEILVPMVVREFTQRASVAFFDDPNCFDGQRPGLLRRKLQSLDDDVGSPTIINISKVNGLRTKSTIPKLSLGEYQQEEIQQICASEIQSETVVLNCQPQTQNCVGNQVEGVCLTVPNVLPGDAVLLQGFNYFSVEAQVLLTAKAPGTISRNIDCHVCGDLETGLTEIVDGTERIIMDSRVKDQLLFTIPTDLPEGDYSVKVIMPLEGDEIISNPDEFIRVLSPNNTTFQIASEELKAIKETSTGWLGSDEVGIKILVTAINSDGTIGDLASYPFRFGNVDSGDVRDMSKVLFKQAGVSGVVISILGHEVDNDNLYEKEVDAFEDAFVEILKSNWQAISGALGSTGGLAAVALGAGASWAAAIGAAITLAVNLIVAYVGRADLIIEDTIALTELELATRTSVNFPQPGPENYTSPGGIDVATDTINKNVQLTEERVFKSGAESSKYRLTLRYNRV
jgi:hypothetical protein